MKVRTALILALIAVVLLVAHQIAKADARWNTRMQSMAKSMTCLAPLVFNDEKFNDPKNHSQLNSCLDDLYRESHSLQSGLTLHATAKSSNAIHQADPMLAYMAEAFVSDVDMAKSLINSSSRTYAQHLLRGSLTYCAGCHTRKDDTVARKFPVFTSTIQDLNLVDRMNLYSAIRNFDEALGAFEAYMKDGRADKAAPSQVDMASRLALSIAVRVESDPARTSKLLDQITSLKSISPEFRIELASWKSSLSDMKKIEGESKAGASALQKAKAIIQHAEDARGAQARRLPEIEYLRATSLLHKFLETNSSPLNMAEALYYLGDSYEHLAPLGFWSMSDVYYRACIHRAPHTEIARRCLVPYLDNVSIGYGGRSGIDIPSNVQSDLTGLKRLAK